MAPARRQAPSAGEEAAAAAEAGASDSDPRRRRPRRVAWSPTSRFARRRADGCYSSRTSPRGAAGATRADVRPRFRRGGARIAGGSVRSGIYPSARYPAARRRRTPRHSRARRAQAVEPGGDADRMAFAPTDAGEFRETLTVKTPPRRPREHARRGRRPVLVVPKDEEAAKKPKAGGAARRAPARSAGAARRLARLRLARLRLGRRRRAGRRPVRDVRGSTTPRAPRGSAPRSRRAVLRRLSRCPFVIVPAGGVCPPARRSARRSRSRHRAGSCGVRDGVRDARGLSLSEDAARGRASSARLVAGASPPRTDACGTLAAPRIRATPPRAFAPGAPSASRTAEFFPGGCAAWRDPLRAPPIARGSTGGGGRRRRRARKKEAAEEEGTRPRSDASSRGPDRETVALAFPGRFAPASASRWRFASVRRRRRVRGGVRVRRPRSRVDLAGGSTSSPRPGRRARASVIARLAFAPPAETRPEQLAYGLAEWVECRATLRLTGGAPRVRVGGGGGTRTGAEEDAGAEVAVSARCELLPPKTPAGSPEREPSRRRGRRRSRENRGGAPARGGGGGGEGEEDADAEERSEYTTRLFSGGSGDERELGSGDVPARVAQVSRLSSILLPLLAPTSARFNRASPH